VVGFWHHKRNTSYGVCTLGSPAVFQLGGWWVTSLIALFSKAPWQRGNTV
jgi:hypothetical protein